jgi:futalosine hydrolase
VVVADQVVAADLGAEADGSSGDGARGTGFLPLDAMGFGPVDYDLDATLVGRARDALTAAGEAPVVGTVLTVSTVTGTVESTQRLADRHPSAVAEAMEGFGVVTATAPWQIPTLELRTISNTVGVSDRHQWDLAGAFAALSRSGCALLEAVPDLLRVDVDPLHERGPA